MSEQMQQMGSFYPGYQMPDQMQQMNSFYLGYQVQLFFSSWMIHSAVYYTLAIVAAIAMAIARELVLNLQHRLLTLNPNIASGSHVWMIFHESHIRACLMTLLHVSNAFLSYLLMLMVMTYNVGFFLAILFGTALGYLLFRLPPIASKPTHATQMSQPIV